MTTVFEVRNAETYLMRQRHAGAQFLRVRADATPEEVAVFDKIRAAAKDGPADYDEAVEGKAAEELFRRRVLFFGRDHR